MNYMGSMGALMIYGSLIIRLILSVLGIYSLILLIKALKIYIKNNSNS